MCFTPMHMRTCTLFFLDLSTSVFCLHITDDILHCKYILSTVHETYHAPAQLPYERVLLVKYLSEAGTGKGGNGRSTCERGGGRVKHVGVL